MPEFDLFEQGIQLSKVSNAGGAPVCIMMALLYLKHACNESDEGVVQRWAETPPWQCQIINLAVELELIRAQELSRVIVDSTVQHKSIAHPTDSCLLETARAKLVQAARQVGTGLKQTHANGGDQLSRKSGRYAHTCQFKRMKGDVKRQRTIVGKLQRKLYIWHATKVGIASTLKDNLIVGVRAQHGNSYDGHTLYEQLEQAVILMQDSAAKPTTAFVDLDNCGVDAANPDVHIVHRCKSKRISEQERHQLRRCQAIEPIIGHINSEHRMDRCHLKGETGDKLHAVLCAAGYNIKWLLRMIAKKG